MQKSLWIILKQIKDRSTSLILIRFLNQSDIINCDAIMCLNFSSSVGWWRSHMKGKSRTMRKEHKISLIKFKINNSTLILFVLWQLKSKQEWLKEELKKLVFVESHILLESKKYTFVNSKCYFWMNRVKVMVMLTTRVFAVSVYQDFKKC